MKPHRKNFKDFTRYRNGKLYSPQGLLENLANPRTPHQVRKLAYEELVIQYQSDALFEASFPVALQQKAIGAYKKLEFV